MAEWGIDLAVACEPYYVPPLTHWVGDVDGTVAVLARSGTGPPLSLIERGSGYVVVGWGKYAIVGTYFSPNRSLAEFETYLGFVRAAVARQSPKPTLVLGDLNANSAPKAPLSPRRCRQNSFCAWSGNSFPTQASMSLHRWPPAP
ncbi:uncharacterized protein LOC124540927 [Vanessa cardui]|uniref:uncharacterized protein LOC124540927 n=1 Tax=Vanessa cardui TaxID=171605 RepID=UPI001F13F946|nr:uncharacterized protein LOC124540927 [Vanessa cardui]